MSDLHMNDLHTNNLHTNKEEILKIIEDEGLLGYSFFEDKQPDSEAVVIKESLGKWGVYTTGMQGEKMAGSRVIFDSEEEALANFIIRLRNLNAHRMKK